VVGELRRCDAGERYLEVEGNFRERFLEDEENDANQADNEGENRAGGVVDLLEGCARQERILILWLRFGPGNGHAVVKFGDTNSVARLVSAKQRWKYALGMIACFLIVGKQGWACFSKNGHPGGWVSCETVSRTR
jgi:hypothetical protein